MAKGDYTKMTTTQNKNNQTTPNIITKILILLGTGVFSYGAVELSFWIAKKPFLSATILITLITIPALLYLINETKNW